MAKSNFEQMLRLCAADVGGSDVEVKPIQDKSFHDVSRELVRQITSPNTLVREQVRYPTILTFHPNPVCTSHPPTHCAGYARLESDG